MIEWIVKAVCFIFVATFFAAVGGVALLFINEDLSPRGKAQDVGRIIGRLKEMGPRVEEFRRVHGRLQTGTEIECDLKPCGRTGFVGWRTVSEGDGSFSLILHSFGVMFTPVHPFDTTWRSREGKTDRDGWDQPWRWYARYYAMALCAVAVILLPWGWVGVGFIASTRRKKLVPS